MIAIVALTPGGVALARRLAPAIDGTVHARDGGDVAFGDAIAHLRDLFRRGVPVVGICASGILVRALAPDLTDKHAEPPVIALAEDGGVAVPLLGGHRGANTLARRIAAALGGTAAITTASDVVLGVALDEPPPGWRAANLQHAKGVAAALLAGGKVDLQGDAPDFLATLPRDAMAPAKIAVGVHAVRDRLAFHPAVLAIGVGCEAGASAEEVIALIEATLRDANLARAAVACLASIDLKADEPAIHEAAARLGVSARFFAATRLAEEEPCLATPSEAVRAAVGVAGVAESAALAAAGPGGTLIVAKRKSARATCAIAQAPAPIDVSRVGAARGELAIIGIGPGADAWRTPEADALLARAEHVVGYGLYLDLVAARIAGKTRHESGLGSEEARARRAIELAASGARVALISSGDAGIYGMATLVFELMARENHAAWNRVALTVAPGLSALQAAAARAGAPLGHDFCAVSLSDLLTPWPVIEKRLAAAAEGDFVVALYNPKSIKRVDQLPRALAILAARRPTDTPVILARNLGRAEESVEIHALAAFPVERVDMLSILIVGAASTRLARIGRRDVVYTPRGYLP